MSPGNRIAVRLFLFVSWFSLTSFVPPETNVENENQILFKIERSKDPDEIWYTTNLHPNGSINREMPIKAFWVKKTANNKIEPLTLIQKRYSYGIKAIDPADNEGNEWNFQLAAYKNRTFKLKRSANNYYQVFILSGNREIALTQIFVKFDGGSFMFPTIAYAKLKGVDPQTGSEITEIITPGK